MADSASAMSCSPTKPWMPLLRIGSMPTLVALCTTLQPAKRKLLAQSSASLREVRAGADVLGELGPGSGAGLLEVLVHRIRNRHLLKTAAGADQSSHRGIVVLAGLRDDLLPC